MSPYQGKTPKRLKEERVVCPAEEERREADSPSIQLRHRVWTPVQLR